MPLHPYIAWAGEFPDEGAALVFAHTAREAKRLSFGTITGWWSDVVWTDLRVRRLRKHADYLASLGDPTELAALKPHVVDDPTSCTACWCWGIPLDDAGVCETCREQEAENAALERSFGASA